MRIFRDYSKASVFGYKIHLRGRFSRKQKASSIFYGKGKLPLNTLSATIDYSFSSMAIKNSLVSIKVWFYRNSYYPQ
jgi:small subunit ribosomal protein S3